MELAEKWRSALALADVDVSVRMSDSNPALFSGGADVEAGERHWICAFVRMADGAAVEVPFTTAGCMGDVPPDVAMVLDRVAEDVEARRGAGSLGAFAALLGLEPDTMDEDDLADLARSYERVGDVDQGLTALLAPGLQAAPTTSSVN